MAELWCIIAVTRGSRKGTYDLTVGHDLKGAVGKPVQVTKAEIGELAKRICKTPNCGAKKLKNKSFARTSVNPRIDIEKTIAST